MPLVQNQKTRHGLRSRRVSTMLAAVICGSVGAYLVFGVFAATSNNPNSLFSWDADYFGPDTANRAGFGSKKAGQIFSSSVYGNNLAIPSTGSYFVLALIGIDGTYLKFIDHTCGSGLHCTAGKPSVYTNLLDEDDFIQTYSDYAFKTRSVVCVDLPPGNYKGKTLYTVRYQAITDIPANLPDNRQMYVQYAGLFSGKCSAKKYTDSNLIDAEAWGYDCQTSVTPSCGSDNGSGLGGRVSGTRNQGGASAKNTGRSGGSGDGTGMNANAGSGGGGGSTTDRQANNPNQLPFASSQGDSKEQFEIDPSPFFDGRFFAAGSDNDAKNIQGISTAGRKFSIGWFYVIGGIVIAGAGGILAWRRWRRGR